VTAVPLPGTALAADLRAEVTGRVAALTEAGRQTRIAIVMATDDASSAWYVQSIVKACSRVSIGCEVEDLGPAATAAQIGSTLRRLSADGGIAGVILQTPLPAGVGVTQVAEDIEVTKDIDGANPLSLGRLMAGVDAFAPATAEAVIRLLDHHSVRLAGQEAVVVGRSLVVGKPLAHLLLQRDATVTVAHSRTVDLPSVTGRAAVLVVAAGRPGLIDAGYVRDGASVVDVGTNVTADGSLAGDVAPDVAAVAGALSPVPGGVGPVTTAVLLRHAAQAAERLTATP
jgi:methylenetetrahydrofolate dehydrogenase (NADP+)/methenyltetrahydrofolate cyclohydrolase